MHNFGRGMWRRVGDYERIQSPLLQARVQQYLAFIEQQKKVEAIKRYQREQTIINNTKKKDVENILVENIKVTIEDIKETVEDVKVTVDDVIDDIKVDDVIVQDVKETVEDIKEYEVPVKKLTKKKIKKNRSGNFNNF